MQGSGALRVFESEHSHEYAVGAGDRQARQVLGLHTLDGVVESETGAYRARAGRHRLLHGRVVFACEPGAAEPAKNDSPLVDDEAGVPTGVADALTDLAQPVAEGAGGDVGARMGADAGGTVASAFDRKSERAPVGLAGDIVVDSFETQAFEPRRGSW